MAKNDFRTLHANYKKLLNDAYRIAGSNQEESARLYAEADNLRKTLFAY